MVYFGTAFGKVAISLSNGLLNHSTPYFLLFVLDLKYTEGSSWRRPASRASAKATAAAQQLAKPVFGILERNGSVHVSVVPHVSIATLLKLTVKKV